MIDQLTQNLAEALPRYSPQAQVVLTSGRRSIRVALIEEARCQEQNLQTLNTLHTLLGQRKLCQIFAHPELALDWSAFQERRLFITKEVIQKIWAGMLDVRKQDLDALANKDLQGASLQAIQGAFPKLIASSQMREKVAALLSPVPLYDPVSTSGKGVLGTMERLWTLLKAPQVVVDDNPRLLYEQTELFTSRLGDREPPLGTVAWFDNGYYAVDRIITQAGAYITAWKHLTETGRCLLVCRGTAFRYSATQGYMSGFNDLGQEIGVLGIKATWPELRQYLFDNRVTTLDVLGKSLGGGHAQYLSTLILGLTTVRVERLVTYCSVGVPAIVQELFAKAIGQAKNGYPSVVIFRNGGSRADMDYIHFVGGVHLFSPNRTRVFYAVPKGQQMPTLDDAWTVAKGLLLSRSQAHKRQTSFLPYDLIESRTIDKEVRCGTCLEPVRQKAAWLFHCITLGKLSPQSFESFYSEQKSLLA